ncbi:DUF1684 domain-containing protein [Deinococcus sonorensis]|uniref:DUF1684 domain-containing protein n=2 Tax=Deinococcus sonorensis TaxID=309891 RepID=A0AAU7UAQ4_9DEIO
MTAPSPDDARLLQDRALKDRHFASGRGPITGERLRQFSGLHYFPPDPALKVEVPVEPGSGETLEVQTTSGDVQTYVRYGQARFSLNGQQVQLALFARPGDEAPAQLFVPFRDATSGRLTYGAGRYLDVPLQRGPAGERVTLDFNRAYHPYCAYADGWSCPLPPPENTLPVAVLAGERLEPDRG